MSTFDIHVPLISINIFVVDVQLHVLFSYKGRYKEFIKPGVPGFLKLILCGSSVCVFMCVHVCVCVRT